MALSGSFGTNYGSFLRIQGDWSATQDRAANTSTVTLRTYWIDRGSSTGISSSASKSGSSTIEGSSSTFSATAGLYSNQKKLIHTQTRTISHNSDGTFPALDLSVVFNPQITFSGATYNTVSASGSFALNTIPRESSIASDCSWTAGYNETISISRGSTSFNHLTQIYVRNRAGTYVHIKNVTSPAAEMYTSSSFSVENHTEIFNILDGRKSADTRFVLHTYSGSTKIGESTHYGTVTIPSRITAASGYSAYNYTDQTIEIPLTSSHPDFTWQVRFKLGSFTKAINGSGTSVTWTPSTAEQAALNAELSNTTSSTGALEIDTFYNGEQVDTTSSRFFVFVVRNANPTFSGSITYRDSNASTSTITGNNQFIIQGRSLLEVTLSSSAASAQKEASLVEYVFSVAGETITRSYTSSALTVSFDTIDATTNQTITVEVVDSRGNRSSISKIVNVVPYAVPSLSASAQRVNGFEETTTLKTSGAVAPVKVGTDNKNYVTSLRYRTRLRGGAWSGYTTISRTDTNNHFVGADRTVQFDITKSYDVEFQLVDRFSTRTIVRTVSIGRPIFFVDSALGSVAFGGFPSLPEVFDMKEQDIVNVDGIYFNSGRGLAFPRSTSGYDNMYFYDGKLWLNDIPYFELDSAGVVRMERDKASNGYNNVTYRDTVNHDDPMLFQTAFGSVSMGGSAQGFVDITWGVAFDSTPVTAMAIATDASSLNYNATVYSLSSTGCRVYLRHLESTTTSAVINIRVMALGRKA